jgi:hypothetical protein
MHGLLCRMAPAAGPRPLLANRLGRVILRYVLSARAHRSGRPRIAYPSPAGVAQLVRAAES